MNKLKYARMRFAHRLLHKNRLFYSLTPELAIATLAALIKCDILDTGAYYEFGLFKGYNLWFASCITGERPAYGFDSFEGTPKAKGAHPYHASGAYAASLDEVRGNLERYEAPVGKIRLFKGWFSDAFFSSLSHAFEPVAVAVIDCDLYVSCVPILEFLRPLLRAGSILIFDDWYMEAPSEREAMHEFLAKHTGITVDDLFDYGPYGHVVRVKEVTSAT